MCVSKSDGHGSFFGSKCVKWVSLFSLNMGIVFCKATQYGSSLKQGPINNFIILNCTNPSNANLYLRNVFLYCGYFWCQKYSLLILASFDEQSLHNGYVLVLLKSLKMGMFFNPQHAHPGKLDIKSPPPPRVFEAVDYPCNCPLHKVQNVAVSTFLVNSPRLSNFLFFFLTWMKASNFKAHTYWRSRQYEQWLCCGK